jgi:uncharacterized protein YndB with AHSA1/START domain
MAEIKHQIPIEVSPEKVYSALVTERGLRSWWTVDTKVQGGVGGQAEFGFLRRQLVFRMKMEKLDPGKLVIWSCHGDHPEWAGTTLTWTIAGDNGNSVLRLTHSGWKEISEFCAICNSSWGELMYRIKNYLEGRQPGPHWTE